jgi:hypothetical protein
LGEFKVSDNPVDDCPDEVCFSTARLLGYRYPSEVNESLVQIS